MKICDWYKTDNNGKQQSQLFVNIVVFFIFYFLFSRYIYIQTLFRARNNSLTCYQIEVVTFEELIPLNMQKQVRNVSICRKCSHIYIDCSFQYSNSHDPFIDVEWFSNHNHLIFCCSCFTGCTYVHEIKFSFF